MRKEGSLRFILFIAAAYIAVFTSLLLVFAPPVLKKIKDKKYIERLEYYYQNASEADGESYLVALYSIDGIKNTRRVIRRGYTDIYHMSLEALLRKTDESEMGKGLVSYIDSSTRLEGLGRSANIIFVFLSDDFLSSADISKAKKQVETTIHNLNPALSVAIVVNDSVI